MRAARDICARLDDLNLIWTISRARFYCLACLRDRAERVDMPPAPLSVSVRQSDGRGRRQVRGLMDQSGEREDLIIIDRASIIIAMPRLARKVTAARLPGGGIPVCCCFMNAPPSIAHT